jgi:hypothetical protein
MKTWLWAYTRDQTSADFGIVLPSTHGFCDTPRKTTNFRFCPLGEISLLQETSKLRFLQFGVNRTFFDLVPMGRFGAQNNLVGNAIKFTPEGREVKLRVMGNEEIVVFLVLDQGIGIPKERQQAIFEPFEQADDSTSRN